VDPIVDQPLVGAEPSTDSGSPRPHSRTDSSPLWSHRLQDLLSSLATSPDGLLTTDAERRLAEQGPNTLGTGTNGHVVRLLLRQFGSPIVLLLIGAASLSVLLHDPTDGAIILAIVAVSGMLGFWQEYNAANIVAALLSKVELQATVIRDGRETQVPVTAVVPGDIVCVSAGSGIPADCRVLDSRDLFVNEAALTGESFPVEKFDVQLPAATPLGRRANALFMGTHAVSGTARAVVVRTGQDTEFGRLSARLHVDPPKTEFERGLRRFGYFLIEVTLLLVTAIFAFNVYLHKPVLDSFLFALALAVGLTPQLLPAIISVNLAKGAKDMAARKVIVKRLTAIENFGSMDVLCSDKTGTLTEGRVQLESAVDALGRESERVWLHAYVNASFQAGYTNPIDRAICDASTNLSVALSSSPLDPARGEPVALEGPMGEWRRMDLRQWTKLDEVPYDFIRRRLTVLAATRGRVVMVSKGALSAVLDACSRAELDGDVVPIERGREAIRDLQARLEAGGRRTLGVAVREMAPGTTGIQRQDEREMTFLGLLALRDPPKIGAAQAIASLARLGVSLKIITGDSALIAGQVARQVGITAPVVLTGDALQSMTDDALPVQAASANVFAEIEPGQKERIIRALQRRGHVVGYMGDGINDAPALHTADVSISVQQAADAAKAAADIVLLEQDLGVLEHGVRDGRRTFANTLKYVFMATSANFGNMFSMAGVSVFLPFLPLLPKQILLVNLLTDLPELTIATDRVDSDWIEQPRRWDVRFIRRFMVVFGVLSSVFDYMTFGVLLWWLRAGPVEFRTGWFLESVVSAALIVLVVRTRRRLLTTPPSAALAIATTCAIVTALALPFTPVAGAFGFAAVPARFVGAMAVIVTVYIVAAEVVKRYFYRPYLPLRRGTPPPQKAGTDAPQPAGEEDK
jgi:Mg2+-importing ATPase